MNAKASGAISGAISGARVGGPLGAVVGGLLGASRVSGAGNMAAKQIGTRLQTPSEQMNNGYSLAMDAADAANAANFATNLME